jgi:hypothetical protein
MMKFWPGAIGRICVECGLIFLLVVLFQGASFAIARPTPSPIEIAYAAIAAGIRYLPLAVLIALFLAFFPVEANVPSRGIGWIGLVLIGLAFMTASLALQIVPFPEEAAKTGSPGIIMPGIPGVIQENGNTRLWYRKADASAITDLVVMDFDHSSPGLIHAPTAVFDPVRGEFQAEGRSWPRAVAVRDLPSLVPSSILFDGSWIWQRFETLLRFSIARTLAAATAFILFAVGFRFVARLTGWPLANAFLAALGLLALLLADAALSSPVIEVLASPLRGFVPFEYLIAAVEAFIGLAMGIIDLIGSPRTRRLLDE